MKKFMETFWFVLKNLETFMHLNKNYSWYLHAVSDPNWYFTVDRLRSRLNDRDKENMNLRIEICNLRDNDRNIAKPLEDQIIHLKDLIQAKDLIIKKLEELEAPNEPHSKSN